MIKKKHILVVLLLLLLIIIFICLYIYIFSKPQINVSNVTVENLVSVYSGDKFIPDYNPVETIEYHFNDGIEKKYKDIQVFWKNEELPSDEPSDYAEITFHLNVKNTTIFDAECKYMLVNDYDDTSEMLIVTSPQPVCYEFNRMSSDDQYIFQIYVYIGDKTEEEIEKIIQSIQIQIPFSNDVYKNDSIYVDAKDVEVLFID